MNNISTVTLDAAVAYSPIPLLSSHPWLVTQCTLWLLLYLFPYIIVRFIADMKWASPTGNFWWIYDPVRSRICQRTIGFTHAVMLTYACALEYVFSDQKLDLLMPNTPTGTKIMRWTLTYFIIDSLLDIVRGPELLYLIHHGTLGFCYFLCLVVYPVGGNTAVVAMAIGESSNVFMVPWHCARFCKWPRVSYWLSFPTTFSFILMRVFIMPFFVYDFIYTSLYTDHGVPQYIINFYYLTFFCLATGSWYWAYLLVRGFLKQFKPSNSRNSSKASSPEPEELEQAQ